MQSNTVVKSFLWDFSGKLARQFVGFGIGIILARLLSTKEFGLISMAMIFIAISDYLVNVGLSSAIVQRKDLTEEHLSSSFYLNFGFSLILAIIYIALAVPISNFFKTPELINVIRVLSLKIVIGGLTIVQRAILTKNMKFRILMRASLGGSIVGGLIGVVMALNGYGVWSLIAQLLISLMVESFVFWFSSEWKPRLIFKINALKELWSYGINLFFSGLINVFFQQLDSFVIAKIFSRETLGLYNRARNLNNFVIRYSSDSINSVMFPAMTALHDDKDRMIKMGLKSESLVSFFTFGLLGWLYLTAEPLIMFLLGNKWAGAIEIYKLLCLSGFVFPLSVTTLNMIKASGDSRTILKIETIKNIINVSGLIIGFLFGLKGYLISLIFSGSINLLINMLFARKSLNLSIIRQLSHIYLYPITAIAAVLIISFIRIDLSIFVELIMLTILFFTIFIIINLLLNTYSVKYLQTKLGIINANLRNKTK